MRKSEKVLFIRNKLNELFPSPAIPLKHEDAYTLLISVLLSAQCTDERVNRITPVLFKKADDPSRMILLDVKEIKEIIRPCG
ncbi:MAG: endonuclease III, partial [Chitinophagales bacterium]|nr:endonuclease III [Chitinophagales bacterium]